MTRHPNAKPARQGGFTLVEMLTVIVIIGILAGLTTAAVIAARKAVIRGIIVADMKQLEMALQNYKTETGEFPPDFAFCDLPVGDVIGDAARARVVRHLRKAFPRMRLTGADDNAKFATFAGLTAAAGPDRNQLNPSTALTFWLGGILDSDGKPRGFHDDPTNPFKLGEPRSKPYYDFNPTRMDGLQLMQPRVQPAAPYVYFRPVRDNTTGRFEYGAAADGVFTPFKYGVGDNYCVPYLVDASADPPVAPAAERVWQAAETYQIIAAGLDGLFSTNTPDSLVPPPPLDFRYSSVGKNFSDGDYDNLTSFTQGELQSEL
jgi:prepilin-type N-terminal cleavage/methylation domain-containing protein